VSAIVESRVKEALVWKHCCEVLQEVFVHKQYSLVLVKNVFVR
jgi:hypothetical protein